jgi:hypothetical protein
VLETRLLAIAAVVVCAGCSSASNAGRPPPSSDASLSSDADASGPSVDAGSSEGDAGIEDFNPTESTFDCVKGTEWTQVGSSVFKNMLGHRADMLAVAQSATGGAYPVGTVIQFLPTEATVKRGAGFSADSHDWEFFVLAVSDAGTTINARGGDAGVTTRGQSCLNCHVQAAQWDLVCGDADGGVTHGCPPIPLNGASAASLRGSDPRCP